MANLPGHPVLTDGETLDQIVKDYFKKGYSYLEILEYLKTYHGKTMSLSTLKRYFKSENYFRRPLHGRRATYDEVKEVVSEEIRGSGSNLGYRRVWSHLKTSGLLVRREDVRLALHELDPENVSKRRRHRLQRRKYRNPGPNYVWHIDGHDKLKPYGLSIHGCIDGYSRRIIWLEVASTNKVPELIAKYYLDALKQILGKPKFVKADNGTEHSIIEPLHTYFSEVKYGFQISSFIQRSILFLAELNVSSFIRLFLSVEKSRPLEYFRMFS